GQRLDGLVIDGQVDPAFGYLPHLLGRDVARLAQHADRDREPVEDVVGRVAGDLLDVPDDLALAVEHCPAGLDHVPGDRVALAHTTLPPTYQTGPCVPTGSVPESTHSTRNSPGIPFSSRRSRQRRSIFDDAP